MIFEPLAKAGGSFRWTRTRATGNDGNLSRKEGKESSVLTLNDGSSKSLDGPIAIGRLGVLVEIEHRKHEFYSWTSIRSISIPGDSEWFKQLDNINAR